MARITVVSAGHMAHCPRMVKAADALEAAGHDVRVVSTVTMPSALHADRALHARRGWRWTTVDYSRHGAPARWLASGIRAKVSTAMVERLGGRVPSGAVAHVMSRAHTELVDAILAERTDLVYSGSVGGISPALEASRRMGIPCGVDFEDYHCGEQPDTAWGRLRNDLAATLMSQACRDAAFLTAGSAGIADACEARFGRHPLPINNVFALPQSSPARTRTAGPLRVYWFSQTIGPGRGIEDLLHASVRAKVPCEVHLRGTPASGYADTLRHCVANARHIDVIVHTPVDPDDMVASCYQFDAGLSAEQGHIPNRAINLSNKALTYPLGGLALILTNTRGQQPLVETLHGEALVYEPGDITALAEGLRRWSDDRASLQRAREASWEAARTRWHWEHPLERDALLAAVEGVIH